MQIPDLIVEKLPLLKKWIEDTLIQYAPEAMSLADLKFPRLPSYCSEDLLKSAKVVIVDKLPMPPLSSWGLIAFKHFENEPFIALSYEDIIFSRKQEAENEPSFFHELVHLLQWRRLGAEGFLYYYVKGLLEAMYYTSPLEVMAFELQDEFENNPTPFDLEKRVDEELEESLKS